MTSNLPRVTIVTPSFNQARFLDETIRSVLDQNYPNLEYFVIDGGSRDGSVEIIRNYADRLAWWVSEEDTGQSEAINKGLQRATGEFVAWLNSDDRQMPGTICSMVDAFKRNPAAGLAYGDVLSIDEQGQAFNVMRFTDYALEDLMAFTIIAQPGVFMRRSVLERAGFLDTRYHYLMDHQLWLRMARLAPLARLDGIVAAARFHPQAKNVAQAARFGQEAYAIVDWMRSQPDLAPKVKRRVVAGARRLDARYLLDAGLAWPSLCTYLASLAAHPPTALAEWHRMIYAALSLVGLQRLKSLYLRLRLALKTSREPHVFG